MNNEDQDCREEEEQGVLNQWRSIYCAEWRRLYGMPEGIAVYKIVEGGAAANLDLRERDTGLPNSIEKQSDR